MLDLVIVGIATFAAQKTASRLADKVHDKILDEAASKLVGAVVRSQNEQLTLLRQIDGKLDALLQGDFRAGSLFLEDAARPHRTPEHRSDALWKARDRFFDALGREGSYPSRAAAIRLYLGLTYVALDEWPDAEESFESGWLEAVQAGRPLMRETMFGFGRANGAAVLMPLLTQLRDARIALGALPTSIPSLRVSGGSSRHPFLLDEAVPGPAALRQLSGLRTSTLERLVVGSGGDDPAVRTDEARMAWESGFTPLATKRTAARLMVERRANWPLRHRQHVFFLLAEGIRARRSSGGESLEAATDTDGLDLQSAWADLYAASPPGWNVGMPSLDYQRGRWIQYAFEATETPKARLRKRDWTALGATEGDVLREMARCLRILGDGRVPKKKTPPPC